MSYLIRAGLTQERPSSVPIGIFYSKTLGDNIGDWIVVNPSGGVSFNVSGTDYILSGTNGTGGTGASNLFKDYILLNETDYAITCLPKWKLRVEFSTGTIGVGDSFGFSLGIISNNTFEARDSLCRLAQDGALVGRFYFYYGDTGSTGINNQTAPAGGFAMANSTRYIFEFEQDELTFTSTLYDQTGTIVHNTKTTTDSPPGGTVAKVHHNTGNLAIAQHGGTTTIHSAELSSDSLRNCKSAFMGDSIAYGGDASSISARWIDQYMTNGSGAFVVMGGWADRMQELNSRRQEIIALNPEYIFIAAGSNDIADGSWTPTGDTALDNMITFFQANTGAQIILVTPTARNDANVTQVKTDMDLKGLAVIDLFTTTKQGGNSNLLGTYNSGDGVHLNDLGHDACSTQAFTDLPEAT